jgi:hypothetical protein
MIRCRAYGHPWDDLGWLPVVRGQYTQTFRCTRCGAQRDDYRLRASLDLTQRIYLLPTGYPGRLPRADAVGILLRGSSPEGQLALAEQSPFVTAA